MYDTSKWDIESMWKILIDKQCLGVQYHQEMMEIFSLIDMKGYCEWQKYQLMEESVRATDTRISFIRKFNKIYVPAHSQETLISKNFLTSNRYSTDNKRKIVDEVFSKWLEWEESVIELLMACVQWCIHNQCPDYMYIEENLEEVMEELGTIRYHYSKLEDSKFDMNNILEWQEYIYPKYREKFYERKKE